MMTAGLMTAVAPFVMAQQPAAAATTTASSHAALTFVDTGGQTVTCTVSDDAVHNTDSPNQPYVVVSSGLSGGSSDCFESVLLTITTSYNDKSGVRRTTTSSAFATSTLKVEGTYPTISTTVTASYFNCDSSRSATCTIATQAAPK
jgi:hypothetical protein